MLKGIREFTHYTKDQRRGIYFLIILVLVLLMLLSADQWFYTEVKHDLARFEAAQQMLKDQRRAKQKASTQALAAFNPNICSKEKWLALGFKGSLADRISRYRAKGGVFREPEDLYKIYGIDSALVTKVLPYVQISTPKSEEGNQTVKERELNLSAFDPNQVSVAELENMGLEPWQARNFENFRTKYRPFEKDSDVFKVYSLDSALARKILPFVNVSAPEPTREKSSFTPVEINTADSITLLEVKGIGPFTAHKILEKRKQLGGYSSLTQLRGQYPIDSARYVQLAPQLTCNGQVKKLNINKASFQDLVGHPYLSYDMVKGIVHFRENIRPFKEVKELKNIELFNDEIFPKIAPYLTVQSQDD